MKTHSTANAQIREWLRDKPVGSCAAFAGGHLERAGEHLELAVIGLEGAIRADDAAYRWATSPLVEVRRMAAKVERLVQVLTSDAPPAPTEFGNPIGGQA